MELISVIIKGLILISFRQKLRQHPVTAWYPINRPISINRPVPITAQCPILDEPCYIYLDLACSRIISTSYITNKNKHVYGHLFPSEDQPLNERPGSADGHLEA